MRIHQNLLLAVTLTLLLVPSQLNAQNIDARLKRPAAESWDAQSINLVEEFLVAPVDVGKAMQEDLIAEQQGLPSRFAIANEVRITPSTHGTWENLDDDTLLWRMQVGSPGAKSINLGFTHYLMPTGARLLIYSPDGEKLIRPFTELDNKIHGELWTPILHSETVVIEVVIPVDMKKFLGLELSAINAGYRGFLDREIFDEGGVAAVQSGSCNVDVICPEGDDWRDQIRSVAVYQRSGIWACTGAMVNNTAQDQTPYFLTANHCGVTSSSDASIVVYWNYENSTCRPPGSGSSGGPGDGPLNMFQTGSTHRASYSPSDFTLVELDNAPNPAWEVSFAGWDNTTADLPAAIAIHHPSTDEKRISFEDDPTTTTSYLSNPVPGDGSHIRVIDWDLGTTEPGSSGSPLFNPDKRIVGQLHGGFASCSSQTSDWYGRVSRSWTGGGSSSSRLSDWLDPLNTGATVLDLFGGGLQVAPGNDVLHIGQLGGPYTNPTVTYTLTNPSPTTLDYSVSLTSSFGILLDGGTTDVTGTLAASGGTVDVIVTLGPDIDLLPAGVYVENIVFEDLTNATSEVRQHTVELGQTNFTTTPGTDLFEEGLVGGPFTNSVVYTLTSLKPTPVSIEVAASDPWISINGGSGPVTINLNGTGTSDTVTVAYSGDANLLPAGLYDGSVTFTNLSGGDGDTSRNVSLAIGQTDFSTDPATGLESGGAVGGPFAGSEVYTLTSLKPSPVAIEVAATESWISINGGAGPVTINLNGTGTTDTVTIAIDSSANALSAAIYEGLVTFTNLTSSGVGDTSRPVTLDVGRVLYPSTDTPINITDNKAIESVLTILDNFCVGDVIVDVDITHSYIGDLTVQLISPSGVAVTLHNRTGGSANFLVETYDDALFPPSGPGLLEDFDGTPVTGDWILSVSDGANGDTGVLNSWALRIAPSPDACATPIVAYEFPLDSDPGWATDGQWAFGAPTGSGSFNGDPLAGYTGINVYGYNLSGDYPNDMTTADYLTTPALNCSNLVGTSLTFRRWLGIESSSFDNANVEVSSDGSAWTTVWAHTATSALSESTWSYQYFDISSVADGEPTVFLRWGMGPTDGLVTYPGWNIDDIRIIGAPGVLDCNDNTVPDDEDISLGNSDDCNTNGVPDECEIDVNSSAPNGPYYCDPAVPPLGILACDADCNENGIIDACDISGGGSDDCNSNGTPDECEADCNGNGVPNDCDCTTAGGPAPLPEAVVLSKSRYITFDTSSVGCNAAIQVTLAASDDFPGQVGASWWVGQPATHCENSSQTTPPPGGCGSAGGGPATYETASLTCSPLCMDWSGIGELHISAEHIVPDAEYEIRIVDCGCDLSDTQDYSLPLSVGTAAWIDVCGPGVSGVCEEGPDGVVDLPNDVLAILEKFSNSTGSRATARTDMRATANSQDNVDGLITVADLAAGLDGFSGGVFPFAGPTQCPAARDLTPTRTIVPIREAD